MSVTKEALKTTLLRNEQGQEAELDLSLMDIHRMVPMNAIKKAKPAEGIKP